METQVNDDQALLRALDEIGEQRKLVSQSQGLIAKNQEQIDRLLLIIEKLTKKKSRQKARHKKDKSKQFSRCFTFNG